MGILKDIFKSIEQGKIEAQKEHQIRQETERTMQERRNKSYERQDRKVDQILKHAEECRQAGDDKGAERLVNKAKSISSF